MPSEHNPGGPAAASKDGGGGASSSAPETNTLWVGNLPPETGDADVMAVFSGHGALDCATTRAGSRSYAFVLFRGAAEARAALDALQGAKVNGASIRNEFSRPARAVRNLWVGGISLSVSKEELEEEFLKFGKIECFAFFRDRNSANVDFYKLEDAISAHRTLNRKILGGEELCVDFQRSKPGRAEWFDASSFSSRGSGPLGSLAPAGGLRGFHGSKKPSGGRKQEFQPTNILWIGFPQSFQINEERLRRAMAAHGEVVKMKCFPSRHYAFVEFTTVDEACNAKKNLEGRLFDDHRIQILFSSSELAPHKGDDAPPFPGVPRSEMFHNEGPYRLPDYFGPGETMATGNIRGPLLPSGVPGANALSRPYGFEGFDPRRVGSGYFDYVGLPSATGILPSPDPHPPFPAARVAWDAFDMREAKRMKVDTYPSDADPYDVRRAGSDGLGDPAGFSHPDRGVPAKRNLSPVIRGQGSLRRTPDSDHYWRGIIAKGGAHVCHARCVPIGNGIEVPLPDVVNCSARTGLDLLAKHYADARGFDIVFFLPDSEEEFASYTEFLRYLGSKNRAGVVKVDAKTTLFLVPPSNFLTEVLHVDGPERLYGVILHIPQISTSAVERPQLTGPEPQSYYDERETVSTLHRNYNIISHNDDYDLNADYCGSLRHDPLHHLGGQIPARARADEARAAQSTPVAFRTNQTAAPQVDVSLRPDIVASLAKLVPGNVQSSVPLTGQMPMSSIDRPAASVMLDASMPSQGWRHEYQATASISSLEQLGNLQHSGQQFSNQAPSAHLRTYGNMLGGQEHPALPITNCPEIQNPTLNLPPPPPPTRPPSSGAISSQGGQYLPSQSQQQYHLDQSYDSQSNYGLLTTTTASSINLPVHPTSQVNPRPLPANNQMGNLAEPQHAMPLPTNKVNMEFSSHGQQLQTDVSGPAQGTSDGDTDKNKRYQTTLQFAASLLLQLQRQQQGAAQSAQGSENQP